MQQLLIGTRDHGLFLCNEKNITPFETETDSYLKKYKAYCGVLLSDSSYAIGTLQGGLVVIDKSGKQNLILNNISRLTSPMIFSLYTDKSGILWAALNDGIAKIEYPSPFSQFDSDAGLKGIVYVITRYRDKIYAGTDRGLFYLDTDSRGSSLPAFRQVEGALQRVWSLLTFNNSLLIALDNGVFELSGNNVRLIHNSKTYSLTRSKLDPDRIFLGHTEGISSLYYKNSKWNNEGIIPGILGSVHSVTETGSGNLWLGTNVNWIWKISFKDKNKAVRLEEPEVKKYSMDEGLPDDVGHLYLFEDQILYVSILHSDKSYRYDQSADKFFQENILDKIADLRGLQRRIRSIDSKGNIWFDLKESGKIKSKMVAWKQADGSYRIEDLK
jgi:ligand-binding sensor domain-containing protein